MKQFLEYDPLLNGAKGLVYFGDKILVYRRDSNPDMYPLYLDLPGGGKEEGETPFQTFQREVREEFGLKIEESDIVYVHRFPSMIKQGEFGYFPVVKFADERKNEIVFGQEGLEYYLMTVEDFLKAPDVLPGLQERTRLYLSKNNNKQEV